jgi:hypothetical protein
VHLDQIPLDGFDHDQMRKRLAAALGARESCVIRSCENDAELAEFCAARWPQQWAVQETEIALAKKFSNRKKQIEAFVSERTKEALASSKIMNSDWRETLETLSTLFASNMNDLDASTTINQTKVRALVPIDYAFFMGVLIGRSASDDLVTKIVHGTKLVQAAEARRTRKERDDYADAKLTEAIQNAMNKNKTRPRLSDAYLKLIESTVRINARSALEQLNAERRALVPPRPPIKKPRTWPGHSTIKTKLGELINQRKK